MSTVGRLKHAFNGNVLTISPTDSIATAVRKMTSHQVGCLLVINEQGKVVGILSERDIISKVIDKSKSPEQTLVDDAMTRKVLTCTLNTPLTRTQQAMTRHRIRHMPVLDLEDGKPVGMISSRDILSHQLESVRAFARQQSKVLNSLENEHPGITQVVHDNSGRVVI